MKKITLFILLLISIQASFSQVNVEVDNSATLYIAKNAYLYVGNNGDVDIQSGGQLIMDSDSDEFSNLYIDGNSTGTAEYRRFVPASGDLVAAPVSGEAFNSFYTRNSAELVAGTHGAGGDILFGPFDNNDTDGFYVEYLSTDTDLLLPGVGYRTRTASGTTLSFQGDISTGNVPITIVKGTGRYKFSNFIGNPYTTYIDASMLITAMSAGGTFNPSYVYIFGYDGDVTSDGSSWTIINNTNATGQVIAPGQGFFVYSDEDGGMITFNENMRVVTTGDDFITGKFANPVKGKRSVASETLHSRFKLKIENTANAGQFYRSDLMFYNSTKISKGLDMGWDAGALRLPDLSISTMLAQDSQGIPFQMQCLSSLDLSSLDLVIPLMVKANEGTSYKISIEESTLPIGTQLYLYDTELNFYVPLEDSYQFIATANNTGRFFITTNTNALSINDTLVAGIRVESLIKTKQIMVSSLINKATLSIIDVSGREIFETSLQASYDTNQYVNVSHIKSGIYVVKLVVREEGNTAVVTKKVVIN